MSVIETNADLGQHKESETIEKEHYILDKVLKSQQVASVRWFLATKSHQKSNSP